MIQISVGRQSTPGTDLFNYFNVTGLRPAYGPVRGGTTVVIVGAGFYSSNPYVIKARRVGYPSVMSVVRASAALLQFNALRSTPFSGESSPESGVRFEFNANGQQYTEIPTSFVYYAPPNVTSIFPHAGPVSGGTIVTINGYFYNTGVVQAMFGAAGPVRCTYVHLNQVVCVSPRGSVGSNLQLAVTVDTPDNSVVVYSIFSPGSSWMYYDDPVLSLMSPPLGMKSTVVGIMGTGFVNTPEGMNVTIGANVFPCYISTPTLVTCSVPPLSPAVYRVQLSLNRQQFHECTDAFIFYQQPVFTMTPTLTPQHGFGRIILTAVNTSLGTNVMNVFGGFVNSSRQNYMFVRVGPELLPAYHIDYLRASVLTTPFASTATVGVSLSLNGQNFTTLSLPVRVYGMSAVLLRCVHGTNCLTRCVCVCLCVRVWQHRQPLLVCILNWDR